MLSERNKNVLFILHFGPLTFPVGAYNFTELSRGTLRLFISAVNTTLCIVMVAGVQVLRNVGEAAKDLWRIEGIRENIQR